jgi:hypothetical protein
MNNTEVTLDQVVEFLRGGADLDGVWFGDHPSGKQPFWWRGHLAKAYEAEKESTLRLQKENEELREHFNKMMQYVAITDEHERKEYEAAKLFLESK